MWEVLWHIAGGNTAALAIGDVGLLGSRVRTVYEAGQRISAAEYIRAVQHMHLFARRLVTELSPYDVLVTPTLPYTAPLFSAMDAESNPSGEDLRAFIPFTYPFNMTGQPAISLPLAHSSDGLPIGVQLVGRPADELTLLAVAAQLERALPWHERRPPLF
jgi:amidase